MSTQETHRYEVEFGGEDFSPTGFCKSCGKSQTDDSHRLLSDAEALDAIAEAVSPWGGEWSDQSGMLETVSNIVESTARVIVDMAEDGDE